MFSTMSMPENCRTIVALHLFSISMRIIISMSSTPSAAAACARDMPCYCGVLSARMTMIVS